ncbi:MAG TPA: Crp/Fnr family transcriptional regulator [Candidatus Acidoferrum sp.]|nr:Crp/Fnr family transcriptional regulator [Candidatus Acidoferrum sp.]
MNTPYGLEIIEDCQACRLQKNTFFCHLPAATTRAIDEAKYTNAYPSGALLFVEGQLARGIWILCKGQVKLTTTSPEGKTIIVRIAEAGELLGLQGVLSGEPYELSAQTLEPCQVAFLRKDDFLKLIREHPEACEKALRELSHYYKEAFHQIRFLGLSRSATEKLARFLVEYSSRGHQTDQGIRFSLGLTHEEIAQIVGVSRETVTRSLTELKEKTIISVHGSSVLICDKAGLLELAAA